MSQVTLSMSLLSYCHPLMVLTSLAERVFAPEIFIHLKRLKASAASPQLRAEVCTAVNLPWLRKVGRPRAMRPKLQSSGFLSEKAKVGHKKLDTNSFSPQHNKRVLLYQSLCLPNSKLPNQCSIGLSRAQGLPLFSRNSR